MVDLDAGALWRSVLAADETAVLEAVAPLTLAERRSGSEAFHTFRTPDATLDARQRAAVAVAEIALGSEAWSMAFEISYLLAGRDEVPTVLVDLCRARGGPWTRALVAAIFRVDWHRGPSWRCIAAIVAAGLVPEPTEDAYAAWAIEAYPWAELPDRLLSEPQLSAALRRTFDVRGAGLMLADGVATQSSDPLIDAYTAATPAGRAGVVEAVLGTLGEPLTAGDLRGWTMFADWLAPTDAELAPHAHTLVSLLAASSRIPVGWAQAVLAREAVPVDGAALLDVSPIVLARPDKGVVRAHLRLLQRGHARGDLPADDLARVLADSLDPERPDLARPTAALLRRVLPETDDALRAEIATLVDERLGGSGDALRTELRLPSSAPPATHTPKVAPAPVDLPARGTLEPVRNADDLVELLGRVLLDRGDPGDLERAFDAMVRLRSEDARAAHAIRRHVREPRSDWTMSEAVGGVVLAWLREPVAAPVDGVERHGYVTRPEDAPPRSTRVTAVDWSEPTWLWNARTPSWVPGMLTYRRTVELRSFAGSGAQLLSTPTSADGNLDGDTLARRLRQPLAPGATWAPHDLGTALLRLDPADRVELERAGVLTVPDALRSLGTDRWARERRTCERSRYAPGEATVWLARDAAPGAPDDPVAGWLDTSTVLTGWCDHTDGIEWRDARWGAGPAHWSTVLVHDPDLLAAHLVPLLSVWADKPTADLVRVVRALGSSRTRLRTPSSGALVRLAGYRDVTVRTATAEAIADAARSGRLDGAVLGGELVALVGPDHEGTPADPRPKLNRVIATLADTARIHDHAEAAVLDALRVLLPVAHRMRGSADTLELTAQLAERRGVPVALPDGLAALASGRSSTRIAVAARRLAATTL